MRAGRRPKAKSEMPRGRPAAPSPGSTRAARTVPRSSGVAARAEVLRASDADLIEEALAGSADALSQALGHFDAPFADARSEAHHRALASVQAQLDAIAMARAHIASLCGWLHCADRTERPSPAPDAADGVGLADVLETVRQAIAAYLDDLKSDAEMYLACHFGEGVLLRSEEEIEALSRRLDARYAAGLDLARRLGQDAVAAPLRARGRRT